MRGLLQFGLGSGTVFVLALATACLAQEGLTIDGKDKKKVSSPEAEKIYFSACSVVQAEFAVKRPIFPEGQTCSGRQ